MKRSKFAVGDEVEFKIKGKVSCVFENNLEGMLLVSIPYLDDKLLTIVVDTKNKKVKKVG